MKKFLFVFLFFALFTVLVIRTVEGVRIYNLASAKAIATLTATITLTPEPTKSPSATPAPRPSATGEVCTVATGSKRGTVNIRSGPGMVYPVIGYAVEGQQLEIIEALPSGWAEIENGYFFIERWCR